ncbi:MAG: SLBB domain-containing protein [Saprospiraceae bacterium]|nr:SLBB domain-containing protein [Saprospiraceae bacterium]
MTSTPVSVRIGRIVAIVLLFMLVDFVGLQAQVSDALIRQQLVERGIDEGVFRQKLRERGVQYESFDQVPPEEYPKVETIVKEIIAELEQANAHKEQTLQLENPTLTPEEANKADNAIQQAQESVSEGASVEEAVIEAVQEEEPDEPNPKIYGQSIFRNQTLKVFRQADNIKPRDNYLLGPGDELTISIWGTSIFERTYTVDESGYINPSAMPRIYLKDLTFRAAKEKLMRNFGAFNRFQPDQFEVSLRYARTISIGIFGEVFNPGSHTISAINSAFNALVAAGGPTDIGTLRKIKWIRSDGTIEHIDVYKYMSDPTIADNFYMSDNDIIQVPIAERIVSIGGAVNRPMRYELIEGEELMQLLDYAGGFRPNAYKEIIQLRRFENDQQKVIDIQFNELVRNGGDFSLKNGDQIRIRTIPTPYKNFVSISGSVELPGEYEFESGMHVSDLLNKAVLTDEAERSYAVLRRSNRDGTSNFVRVNLDAILNNPAGSENLLLVPSDQLVIYSRGKFIDQYQVTVSGQVRSPGSFAFDPSRNMRLRDVVLMAGGLNTQATDFAYIIRKALDTGEPEYISIDLTEAMRNPASDQNLVIQPNDEIRILSKTSFIEDATVTIAGAVRNPGSFAYDESMTIKDLITLASGFRLEAATNRVEVTRLVIEQNEPTRITVATLTIDQNLNPVGVPDFSLQPYDRVYVRTVPEFEFPKVVSIAGEVRYPGPYTILTDNERITSLVRRAGGITKEAFPEGATLRRSFDGTGPIVIQLDKVLNNENIPSNIILKDGDEITIPKIKDFVAVAGAVNTTKLYRQDLLGVDNRITVVFDGKHSARYYIEQYAGGFSENGDRRKVTVEYPNGTIKEAKDYGLFMMYPKVEKGSIVRVGIKDPEATKPETEKEPIDWGEVLSSAVTQATAVLTLILLIDRAGR